MFIRTKRITTAIALLAVVAVAMWMLLGRGGTPSDKPRSLPAKDVLHPEMAAAKTEPPAIELKAPSRHSVASAGVTVPGTLASASTQSTPPAVGESPVTNSPPADAGIAGEPPTASGVVSETPRREIIGTARMVAAHASLRTPEVADPDSSSNRQILDAMIKKAIARREASPTQTKTLSP